MGTGTQNLLSPPLTLLLAGSQVFERANGRHRTGSALVGEPAADASTY